MARFCLLMTAFESSGTADVDQNVATKPVWVSPDSLRGPLPDPNDMSKAPRCVDGDQVSFAIRVMQNSTVPRNAADYDIFVLAASITALPLGNNRKDMQANHNSPYRLPAGVQGNVQPLMLGTLRND